MTDANKPETQDLQGAEAVAAAAVVERVRSYHEGAPVETVRRELAEAAAAAGVEVSEQWLQTNAQEISDADPATG
jgi:hypothetical protein